MTKTIPDEKACGGRRRQHGFRILIAALFLAFIAWSLAEIHGEVINSPTTRQDSVLQG